MRKLSAAVAACLLLLLAGCAVMPDFIGPTITHDSHITQHIGASRTNYGSETLGVSALWLRGRVFAEITEGAILGPRWKNAAGSGYGEMLGPRESFSATFGYLFKVH